MKRKLRDQGYYLRDLWYNDSGPRSSPFTFKGIICRVIEEETDSLPGEPVDHVVMTTVKGKKSIDTDSLVPLSSCVLFTSDFSWSDRRNKTPILSPTPMTGGLLLMERSILFSCSKREFEVLCLRGELTFLKDESRVSGSHFLIKT